MRIDFANDTTFNDYYEWVMQDKKIAKKIMSLIKDISRSPYAGIGHPEPLKYELSGYWSREITEEHRLVYKVVNGAIEILSCRFHYEK